MPVRRAQIKDSALDVTTLAQLSSVELREAWPQWFDQPPPLKASQDLLRRALAYRLQERAAGGLSPATRKKLQALAEAMQRRPGRGVARTPRLTPGTRLMRQWREVDHYVTVEETGFAYRGTRYRSLSEIARAITGTRWSGPAFFGIKPTGRGKEVTRHGR